MITPCNVLARQAAIMAGRSIVRTRSLMPTAARSFATASARGVAGGKGLISPASKPLGYPTSFKSCLAWQGRAAGTDQRSGVWLHVSQPSVLLQRTHTLTDGQSIAGGCAF